MVTLRPADEAETAAWLARYEDHLMGWFDAYSCRTTATNRVRIWHTRSERLLAQIERDGETVGHVMAARHPDGTAGQFPDAVVIYDIWVRPEFRHQGYGRVAVDHVREWAKAAGAPVLAVSLWGDDQGVAALFADFPLRSQRMVKLLGDEPLPADAGWTYRPLRPGAEYDEWRRREIEGYAADIRDSGSATPERAIATAEAEYAQLLPEGLDTPAYSFCVVEAAGEPVADIWLGHTHEMGYVYGVEVRPEARGKGYGRAAMLAGEATAWNAGDRFLGLNVFGHNHVAIRLYERMGYDVVDSIRSVDLG